jgi:hypothetical protein
MANRDPSHDAEPQAPSHGWHIVEHVPLAPVVSTTPAPASTHDVDDAVLYPTAENGRGAGSQQASTTVPLIWGELDALLSMPEPPIAPAVSVVDAKRHRAVRRRRVLRRVRRMSIAAGVGVLLGAAAWLWGPIGWQHPLALHLGGMYLGSPVPHTPSH